MEVYRGGRVAIANAWALVWLMTKSSMLTCLRMIRYYLNEDQILPMSLLPVLGTAAAGSCSGESRQACGQGSQ